MPKTETILPTTIRAYAVTCPQCDAPAGETCRTPGGSQLMYRTPHFARREAGAQAQREARHVAD